MSGWTVNRGGSSTLNGKVPHDEPAPSVEAELVEKETTEVYATEPEERPDSQSDTPVEEFVEVKLRSLIPVEKEDYEKGFRCLTDDERKKYGISKGSLTRENAAKQEFNLSATTIGKHVAQLLAARPPFPRGYLLENGNELSDRCRFEIFQKIENSAEKILPGNPSDWRNLKKTKKQINPKYKTHRFKYWEERARKNREYHEWLHDQPEPEVEVHQAEFVSPTEEPPEDREERLSKQRSAIQLAETEDERVLRALLRQRDQRLIDIVVEETLSTVERIHKKRAEILGNPDASAPPELDDEDEDL